MHCLQLFSSIELTLFRYLTAEILGYPGSKVSTSIFKLMQDVRIPLLGHSMLISEWYELPEIEELNGRDLGEYPE